MEKIAIKELFKDCFLNPDGSIDNTVNEKVIEVLITNKLLKCFQPKEYGGLALGLTETLEVIEQCAFVNGSLGWLVQIGNGGSYFITNLQGKVAKELFSPRDSVLTGSGTPTGEAKKVDGGFLFTGYSKFCSGSDYATLFTATGFIEGTNEVISGIVPRREVTITKTWNPLGMKATSSCTSHFKNVFVPSERVFKTMERISHFDLPILNLPFLLFAQAFFIQVVYGLIERFLEETKVVLNLKKELWQAHLPKRISDVENFVRVTKHLLRASKNQSCFYFGELECGVSYSEEQQGIVRKEITEQARQLKNQIHSNFYLFGMDVLDDKHVLNIVYCDLITITQHQLLNND